MGVFSRMNHQPFFTMGAEVPRVVAGRMMRVPKLDGIGPGSADGAVLGLMNQHGTFTVLGGNVVP